MASETDLNTTSGARADVGVDRDAVFACADIRRQPGGEEMLGRIAAGDPAALDVLAAQTAIVRMRRRMAERAAEEKGNAGGDS